MGVIRAFAWVPCWKLPWKGWRRLLIQLETAFDAWQRFGG